LSIIVINGETKTAAVKPAVMSEAKRRARFLVFHGLGCARGSTTFCGREGVEVASRVIGGSASSAKGDLGDILLCLPGTIYKNCPTWL
jgi:hypothetical protein